MFRRAMVSAPWTLPSHATMFTGCYPQELTASWYSPLNGEYPTLAESLRDRGYLTAGFVANKYFASTETGLNRGFIEYHSYFLSPGAVIECCELPGRVAELGLVRKAIHNYELYGVKNAEEVNRDFLEWVDGQDRSRPFFAFVNYFDAHHPYPSHPPFDSRFGRPATPDEKVRFVDAWRKPEEFHPTKDAAICAYDGAIAYLDDQLDRLLNNLAAHGMLQNTVVVITSDHGEQFGEHDLFLHGQSLYRHLVHVPLIILQPGGVPAHTVVDDYVTMRDLPATILELTHTPEHLLPGRSLCRFWQPRPETNGTTPSPLFQVAFHIPNESGPDRGCSPVASGNVVSLFLGRHYYIKNLDTGSEEIYDFEGDPLERYNLAQRPEHKQLLGTFRTELTRVLTEYPSRWADLR